VLALLLSAEAQNGNDRSKNMMRSFNVRIMKTCSLLCAKIAFFFCKKFFHGLKVVVLACKICPFQK